MPHKPPNPHGLNRAWLDAIVVSPQPWPAECLVYPGAILPPGHGVVWVEGKPVATHLFIYRSCFGAPPPKHRVEHLPSCVSRACCNPGHLRATARASAICTRCGIDKAGRSADGKSFCKPCAHAASRRWADERKAAGHLASETQSHRKMRFEVLAHYSGGTPSCACCAEQRIEFLSLDHVNGGGAQHRRSLRQNGSRSIYRDARINGYPSLFRVLCHNCNQSMGLYGYCPHTDPSRDTAAWMGRPASLVAFPPMPAAQKLE